MKKGDKVNYMFAQGIFRIMATKTDPHYHNVTGEKVLPMLGYDYRIIWDSGQRNPNEQSVFDVKEGEIEPA